jgi:hypothetical protein
MKYYTVESHAEKEAPFGITWQVKLFDEHTLLEEYDHIFYNEIAGYCKCLEDIGFLDERWTFKRPQDEEIHDFVKMCIKEKENALQTQTEWYEMTGNWPNGAVTLD